MKKNLIGISKILVIIGLIILFFGFFVKENVPMIIGSIIMAVGIMIILGLTETKEGKRPREKENDEDDDSTTIAAAVAAAA